jgi:hypothetical protein
MGLAKSLEEWTILNKGDHVFDLVRMPAVPNDIVLGNALSIFIHRHSIEVHHRLEVVKGVAHFRALSNCEKSQQREHAAD